MVGDGVKMYGVASGLRANAPAGAQAAALEPAQRALVHGRRRYAVHRSASACSAIDGEAVILQEYSIIFSQFILLRVTQWTRRTKSKWRLRRMRRRRARPLRKRRAALRKPAAPLVRNSSDNLHAFLMMSSVQSKLHTERQQDAAARRVFWRQVARRRPRASAPRPVAPHCSSSQ